MRNNLMHFKDGEKVVESTRETVRLNSYATTGRKKSVYVTAPEYVLKAAKEKSTCVLIQEGY